MLAFWCCFNNCDSVWKTTVVTLANFYCISQDAFTCKIEKTVAKWKYYR